MTSCVDNMAQARLRENEEGEEGRRYTLAHLQTNIGLARLCAVQDCNLHAWLLSGHLDLLSIATELPYPAGQCIVELYSDSVLQSTGR